MLHSIPTDIVELIILKSFDYGVFQKLQEFLTKLNEPSRISRINDKLTICTIKNYAIEYKLNGLFHKEYDKPDYIAINIHMWSLHNDENRKDNPSTCLTNGTRGWMTKGMLYNTDDCPCFIYNDGVQDWHDKDRIPSYINVNGDRSNNNCIFNYLR